MELESGKKIRKLVLMGSFKGSAKQPGSQFILKALPYYKSDKTIVVLPVAFQSMLLKRAMSAVERSSNQLIKQEDNTASLINHKNMALFFRGRVRYLDNRGVSSGQ